MFEYIIMEKISFIKKRNKRDKCSLYGTRKRTLIREKITIFYYLKYIILNERNDYIILKLLCYSTMNLYFYYC